MALAGLIAAAAGAVAIALLGGDDADRSGPEGKPGGWTALTASPLARTEVGAARVGRFIYVVGGFLPPAGDTTDQVARYDTETGDWSMAAPMPVAVNHPAVAAQGGRVYVYGGYAAEDALEGETDALQRFDPATGEWRRLSGSGSPRGAATLAAVGDSLYAIGGASGGSPLSLVQVYDISGDLWRAGPSMKVAREHLASAVLGERILVLGGRIPGRNLDTVEALDPHTRRWSTLAPLNTARSGFGAAAVGGRGVVALGGETVDGGPEQTIGQVELYEPSSGRWRELAEMPTPRHGLGVVSLGRDILAIEGGPQPGLAYSDALEQLTIPEGLLGETAP